MFQQIPVSHDDTASPLPVNQFHDSLQDLGVAGWQYAVPEIENMPTRPGNLGKDCAALLLHYGPRSQDHRGIEISLRCHSGWQEIASSIERQTPIQPHALAPTLRNQGQQRNRASGEMDSRREGRD